MKRRLALILSGGGARGAYEVGVLSYVLDDLARRRGRPPRIDLLSGTSVGAINACYLAAHMSDPTDGVRRLAQMWRALRLDDILGFGARHALSLPRVLTGGPGSLGAGLFDVSPIRALIEREIRWRDIERSLRERSLSLLSVSATEVSTGRTAVFMQTGPHGALPTTAPPRTVLRSARIGPEHALASAAIPVLFPPVKIGAELYFDGGVRQNTPISPALRAGATHVFAIGLSREERGIPAPGETRAPGAAFLMGKVLNAVLLDHVDADIELLRRQNAVLDDGELAFGPDFAATLSRAASVSGRAAYRRVEHAIVRPTEDIGRLAADHLRAGRTKSGSRVVRRLLGLLDVGVGTESDLVSYLLFDGEFASRLIDLGRADAAARRDELLAFFDGDDAPPEPSDDGPMSLTPPPPVIG
ncbi:MAG: patatin-like phospholipase family protein [Polyangiaceae bacterium]|nr:patatin-like phospholipase family protein [Polyangiaceae bacterium]